MSLNPVSDSLIGMNRSKPQIVVHRDFDLLLRAQVAFGGLDGGVAEQELDLFDIAAILAAEFGAGAAQVVRPKALDPDLPGRFTYGKDSCWIVTLRS